MISYARFAKLRLAQFLPEAQLAELVGWEFTEAIWVGEALGFSEWLRLESEPNVLRSLALDFSAFPEAGASAVLQTIDLPIKKDMRLTQLRAQLGEPIKELRFTVDRVTYKFTLAGPVHCTQ